VSPDTPSKHDRQKTFISIQYLRGISAVLVIFFHAAIQSTALSGVDVPTFGKLGVDVFFVISGFVMWESVTTRPISPILFLKKRFCRIVPLYWTFTLAAASVAFVKPQLLRSTIFNLPHLIASLAFVPWINPVATGTSLDERITPVINPGWTLIFEMLFYVLFASILILPRRLRFPILIAEMLLIHGTAVYFRDAGAVPQFYAQNVMFEFLFGILIAIIVPRYRAMALPIAAGLVALALAALLWGDLVQPVAARWLWLGVPAAVLVTASVDLERAGWMPQIAWLGRIGGASYSIYLSHVFVVAGARTVIQGSGAGGWSMQPLIFIPLAVIASIAVGMVVHHRIERPLTALSTRLLRA
jgi:exopolysaccharide production protein ExoZ